MRDIVGILFTVFVLLLLSQGEAELIFSENCKEWLSEFEREISQMEPVNSTSFPEGIIGQDTVFEQYDFGFVKRHGERILSITITAPTMVDCRDGYIDMPFDWKERQINLPIETILYSRNPPAFCWTFADSSGRYAVEWFTMDEDNAYILTYLLTENGVIREIRFRRDETDSMTTKAIMDAAEQLRMTSQEGESKNADPGDGSINGDE